VVEPNASDQRRYRRAKRQALIIVLADFAGHRGEQPPDAPGKDDAGFFGPQSSKWPSPRAGNRFFGLRHSPPASDVATLHTHAVDESFKILIEC
jgi:hypothetical protein